MITSRRAVVWWILLAGVQSALFRFGARAQDAGYEYVQQVLDEDRDYFGDYDNPYTRDEDVETIRGKASEDERLQREAEERLLEEESERVRQQREAEFEKEVSKMNEDQAKAARAQKQKDAAVVRRILRQFKNENHYAVLGLRNFELHLPAITIGSPKFKVRIPGFTFFRISTKAIKKAYRQHSLKVHPDRNRDGRAREAFMALENSASILQDEQLRLQYDEFIRYSRQLRRRKFLDVARVGFERAFSVAERLLRVVHRVLGPFFVPALILGALIV